jgi:hypothetical protein
MALSQIPKRIEMLDPIHSDTIRGHTVVKSGEESAATVNVRIPTGGMAQKRTAVKGNSWKPYSPSGIVNVNMIDTPSDKNDKKIIETEFLNHLVRKTANEKDPYVFTINVIKNRTRFDAVTNRKRDMINNTTIKTTVQRNKYIKWTIRKTAMTLSRDIP